MEISKRLLDTGEAVQVVHIGESVIEGLVPPRLVLRGAPPVTAMLDDVVTMVFDLQDFDGAPRLADELVLLRVSGVPALLTAHGGVVRLELELAMIGQIVVEGVGVAMPRIEIEVT